MPLKQGNQTNQTMNNYTSSIFVIIKSLFISKSKIFSVGWGCRIHRQHLCNECLGYDTKQSHGEVQV